MIDNPGVVLQGPHGIPRSGTLDSRERWRRFWHGGGVDHLPDYEFGWWEENFDVWQDQGLPAWVDGNYKGDVYFRLEMHGLFPANTGVRPGFDSEQLEIRGDKRIIRDHDGVICEVPLDGHSTVPHYLKFPVETRADWLELRKRLDPADPFRVPVNLEAAARRVSRRDYAMGIHCGSLFGAIRNWMGFEGACVAVKEDRALIEEMMEHLTNLTIRVLEKVLPYVELDFASFWEDMAFKSGPMISPADFKELMVPRYRRITRLLEKYGIDVVYVDCDGNVVPLVPLWLDAGVNVMFPVEVHGGSDPVDLRRRFGRDLKMLGGVDKMKLIAGRDSIDAELKRLAPLVEEGLFIPHVDHRCPPDVSLANYRYYLSRKRALFGIPDPG
jgi:uroporphyrinogen decarboxylase